MSSDITFDESASAPATPATGKVVVYAKTDGSVYQKDDAGTETSLAAGGGGGGAPTTAQYVVMALDATLSAERTLAVGPSLALVDGGANGAATLSRAALTGDVTAAADSNATTLANDAVTLAKMQNIATDRLLGRDTAASGDPEELTVGGGIEFTGAGGIQTSALTGDVTKTAGGTATTIAANAVSDTKLRDSAAVSVIGRAANTGGDPADIAAAANDQVLRRTADTVNFGALTVGMAPNDIWTYAKLQDISATDRLLGRDTVGAGDPEELTVGGGIEFTGAGGIQTSALTGDVTKTAGGTATTIAADTVTFAKMQNIATDRLLGRDTAASGDPEELTVGGGIEFTGAGGIQTSALTGDVTKTAGGTATTIANDAVSNAKAANMANNTVKGRSTAGTGDPEDLTAAQVIDILETADGAGSGLDADTVDGLQASVLTAVSLNFIIDGGGSAITTGQKGHVEIPFACTVTGWTILADQSGSIVVDVWKDTYANFPPTVADTIAGSEKPTLSSVQKNQDLTLTTWTTAVAAGDILAFNVDSITTVTRVTVSLRLTKT